MAAAQIDLSKYGHLLTTSAKIRAMAADGFSTNQIAKAGLKTKEGKPIRYQHVRNVLTTSVGKSTGDELAGPPRVETAKMGADGRVLIPADYRRVLGLGEGVDIVMAWEGDSLRLMSRDSAIRRAQAEIAKYVPTSVSLVDELIAERRREAEREDNE